MGCAHDGIAHADDRRLVPMRPDFGYGEANYNLWGIIVDTGFRDFEAALLVQLHPRHIAPRYCTRKQPEGLQAKGVTR